MLSDNTQSPAITVTILHIWEGSRSANGPLVSGVPNGLAAVMSQAGEGQGGRITAGGAAGGAGAAARGGGGRSQAARRRGRRVAAHSVRGGRGSKRGAASGEDGGGPGGAGGARAAARSRARAGPQVGLGPLCGDRSIEIWNRIVMEQSELCRPATCLPCGGRPPDHCAVGSAVNLRWVIRRDVSKRPCSGA